MKCNEFIRSPLENISLDQQCAPLYEGTLTSRLIFVMLSNYCFQLDGINGMVKWMGIANVAGGIVGLIGLIISFAGRGMMPGRLLGDPVPLMLTAQNIFRGNFLYLNWHYWVWPLLFFGLVALLVVAVLHFMEQDQVSNEADAKRAAQIAVGINVGLVAFLEIDAMMVAIWYLMTGFVAVSLTSFMAGRLMRFMKDRVDLE